MVFFFIEFQQKYHVALCVHGELNFFSFFRYLSLDDNVIDKNNEQEVNFSAEQLLVWGHKVNLIKHNNLKCLTVLHIATISSN